MFLYRSQAGRAVQHSSRMRRTLGRVHLQGQKSQRTFSHAMPKMQFTAVYPPPPKKTSLKEIETILASGSPASHDGTFGRQWHVGLKSVPLLLQAAEKKPELLSNCEALWIESPDKGDVGKYDIEKPEVFAKKCEALSRLLDITASHGRLQRFDWTWTPGVMDSGQPEISAKVWTSLAKNRRTLRSLNVTHTAHEYGEPYLASWGAFALEGFSALRNLDLGLERAHGWPASKLHQALKGLPGLTSLHLRCPYCCGLEDFALASHHPNLKSLTIHATTYPNQVSAGDLKTEDFLKRHPSIEFLDLMYLQDEKPLDGELKLDSEDLPNLRAIHVGSEQLEELDLTSRPIEAVSFDGFPEFETVSTLPTDRIKYVFMKLDEPADLQREAEDETWPLFLAKFPALTELRLYVPTAGWGKRADPMNERYLTYFLKLLSSTPSCASSLTALSFVDTLGKKSLKPAVLDNLPCDLTNLKYLGWDMDQNKWLYELHRSNGKVTGTPIQPLRPPTARNLFVDEAILDHFGERAREW